MENASASSQHLPKELSGNSKIVGRASVPRESEAIVHGKFSGISLTNDTILFTWPSTYPNLLYLKGAHKSNFGLHCSIFSLLMFPGIGCYHHLQCLHTNLLVPEVLAQCRAAFSTRYLNRNAIPCAMVESHQTDKSFREVWATWSQPAALSMADLTQGWSAVHCHIANRCGCMSSEFVLYFLTRMGTARWFTLRFYVLMGQAAQSYSLSARA